MAQQQLICYFHTQWKMRLMLMIRTLLHAILTNNVVIICMRFQSYFGMNLFQTITFLWKLSWKNSEQDGKDQVITFSCVLVILLRYVFSHSSIHHFSTHEFITYNKYLLSLIYSSNCEGKQQTRNTGSTYFF